METIYKKILTWALGEAMANSDRVKVAIGSVVGVLLVKLLAYCPACSSFLTPENQTALTQVIEGAGALLIAAFSHRDIGAPGQSVPGAAAGTPTSVVAAAAAASVVAKS